MSKVSTKGAGKAQGQTPYVLNKDEKCPKCGAKGDAVFGGKIEFLAVSKEEKKFVYHCLICNHDFSVPLRFK